MSSNQNQYPLITQRSYNYYIINMQFCVVDNYIQIAIVDVAYIFLHTTYNYIYILHISRYDGKPLGLTHGHSRTQHSHHWANDSCGMHSRLYHSCIIACVMQVREEHAMGHDSGAVDTTGNLRTVKP